MSGNQGHEAAAHLARLAMLGELAGALVHALGQPLNVLRLTAENGRDRLERGVADPAQLFRAFATVLDQADCLRAVLDDLSAAARPGQGPPAGAVDVVAAVEAALDRLRPRLDRMGVRLVWRPPSRLPAARGEMGGLVRALGCLLDNACDAMAVEAGGELTVVVAEQPGGVAIAVTDSGPGLPPGVLRAIGVPTTDSGGEGRLGLGLTIALGTIAAMGGEVRAANMPGGARVTVVLPAEG